MMKTYRLFLGSPDDVTKECGTVIKSVDFVNSSLGLALESRFETYCYGLNGTPGFAESAQHYIEADAGKINCAIFLLWHKFGTPVEGARSGWESEFFKFVEQRKKTPEFEIKFFVKTQPINPRDIDGKQLELVNEFLATLSKKYGGVYQTYSKPAELERALRTALSKTLQSLDSHSRKNAEVII